MVFRPSTDPHWQPLQSGRFIDEETEVEIDLTALAEAIPPYACPEEMEVNMRALVEVCRSMRLKSLRVLVDEKEAHETEITGINDDGTAVGSGRTTIPEDNPLIEPNGPVIGEVLGRSFDFGAAEITINMAKFREKIRKDGINLRDSSAWTKFLSEDLAAQLKALGLQRLSGNLKKLGYELTWPVAVLSEILEELRNRELDKNTMYIAIMYNLVELTLAIATLVLMVQQAAQGESLDVIEVGLEGTITIYLIALFKAKAAMSLGMRGEGERWANKYGVPVKYDPVTFFTLGDWEWDRKLGVRESLSQPLLRINKASESL
jgi:hypothetical protein